MKSKPIEDNLMQSPRVIPQIVIHETEVPMNKSQKRITRNIRLQSKDTGEVNQSVDSVGEAGPMIKIHHPGSLTRR